MGYLVYICIYIYRKQNKFRDAIRKVPLFAAIHHNLSGFRTNIEAFAGRLIILAKYAAELPAQHFTRANNKEGRRMTILCKYRW